jgi:hypothetical protein
MFERREAIYASLGVPAEPAEDPLERYERTRPRPESESRKPGLQVADVDGRINQWLEAERENERALWIDTMGWLLSRLRRKEIPGIVAKLPELRGPPGPQGAPGKLPLVKVWKSESVYYEGEVVTHEGGTYQALCDTGQAPGHPHWACLATPGRDGRTPRHRGAYREGVIYDAFDVVVCNGSALMAMCDEPGPCPGNASDKWRLLAAGGRRGVTGERGPQGERGPRGEQGKPGTHGTTILAWKVDRQSYSITPVMSDGTDGPSLELRGLFEQFHTEARG